MKKVLLFIAVIAVIAGCSKKEVTQDNPIDIWNGYGHLKSSSPVATLWAGKNTDVGTVTYGIDDAGHFTATYELADGWVMSESHLYAETVPLQDPRGREVVAYRHRFDTSYRNRRV